MKRTALEVICEYSGLQPETVTKCFPWVIKSCELYANQPTEQKNNQQSKNEWRVDVGMDELHEDNFRIAVYDGDHNQIHVFGTTPGKTEKFANNICNALNAFEVFHAPEKLNNHG